MKDGQRAKYTQDELCKKVLLKTKKAKLVHIVPRRGKPTLEVPFISTMEIRENLQSNIALQLEEKGVDDMPEVPGDVPEDIPGDVPEEVEKELEDKDEKQTVGLELQDFDE